MANCSNCRLVRKTVATTTQPFSSLSPPEIALSQLATCDVVSLSVLLIDNLQPDRSPREICRCQRQTLESNAQSKEADLEFNYFTGFNWKTDLN